MQPLWAASPALTRCAQTRERGRTRTASPWTPLITTSLRPHDRTAPPTCPSSLWFRSSSAPASGPAPRRHHGATCASRGQAKSTTWPPPCKPFFHSGSPKRPQKQVADPRVSIPEPVNERHSVAPAPSDRRMGPDRVFSIWGTNGVARARPINSGATRAHSPGLSQAGGAAVADSPGLSFHHRDHHLDLVVDQEDPGHILALCAQDTAEPPLSPPPRPLPVGPPQGARIQHPVIRSSCCCWRRAAWPPKEIRPLRRWGASSAQRLRHPHRRSLAPWTPTTHANKTHPQRPKNREEPNTIRDGRHLDGTPPSAPCRYLALTSVPFARRPMFCGSRVTYSMSKIITVSVS